jgi:mycofactocin precursor
MHVTDVEEDAMSNEDVQTVAVENTAEVEEDVLVEDVSIDGMCGVY